MLLICSMDTAVPLVAILYLYHFNEVCINVLHQFQFPFLMSRVIAFEIDVSEETNTLCLF